jgi:hypothetical protein
MSTASRSLSIVFIRDVVNHANDDVVSIVPSDDSDRLYNVTYRDSHNNIRNNNTCTDTEVFDFVENLFNLLPIDEDPFTFVQISAPAFPSILLKINRLEEDTTQDSIMNIVRNTIRNWPSATNMKRTITTPTSRPTTRSLTARHFS